MTDTPVPTEPQPTSEPSSAVPPPRFLRSREDRWLGGVCAGIADHFGVDVMLVRIVAVALTFFGGVGIAAYVAAWVLVPDGPGPSLAERVLRRRSRNLAGVVLVVVTALVLASAFHHIWWWWTPAPVIGFTVLAVAVLVLRRRAARIAVAAVLALVFAGTVTVLAAGRSLSSRSVTVRDASDLDDDYRLGVGTLTLDLSHLAPLTTDRDVDVRVGSGKARIILPSDVPTHVDARTGVGSVEVAGDDAHGFGPSRTTDVGLSAPGTGRLVLHVHVGVGDADVTTSTPA